MIDYRLPLLHTSEAILLLSGDLVVDFANPAALRMMRLPGELAQHTPLQALLDDSSEGMAAHIELGLQARGHWSGDIWLHRLRADPLPVRLVVDRYQDHHRIRHTCVISDISRRRQTEARLTQLSRLDALTGLFNRAYFMRQLESKLRRLRRENLQYALLFVDVDDLKYINDSWGHLIGDLCLCEVARRLMQAVQRVHREHDPMQTQPLVARLGGDEFVILLRLVTGTEAQHIARSISQLMTEAWYPRKRHRVTISTSIGIAYAPLHGDTSQKLLQLADHAMYHAKSSRKGSVQEFIRLHHPQAQMRFETGFDSLPPED